MPMHLGSIPFIESVEKQETQFLAAIVLILIRHLRRNASIESS